MRATEPTARSRRGNATEQAQCRELNGNVYGGVGQAVQGLLRSRRRPEIEVPGLGIEERQNAKTPERNGLLD